MENYKLTYTTIIHSARNKLRLSNNEYILCDTIYHLSNNPEYKYCIMSKDKLGEIIGVSKQAIHKLLIKMIKLGLIEKEETLKGLKTTKKWYNTVILKDESTKFTDSKESLPLQSTKFTPTVNKVYSDSKQSLHNNNNNNTNYNNKDKELTDFLLLEVKKRYPFVKDKTEKQLISNYEEMNKLNRIDGYDYETISLVIRFSQYDEFWKRNIRSVDKLRIKFETLLIQAQSKIKEYQDNKIIKI